MKHRTCYRPPLRALALLAGLTLALLAGPADAQWTELGVPQFLDQSDWRGLGNEPYKYGHKPQVLVILDNTLTMNRRPYHAEYPAGGDWYHAPEFPDVGGVGARNRYSLDWVPSLYHVAVQALVGEYEDPDTDDDPSTRTPWRMRTTWQGAKQWITDPVTLLDGAMFQDFNVGADFTTPGTDPLTDYFPVCRTGGGAPCAAAVPDWLKRPIVRRSVIWSDGNGRKGFFDWNQDMESVRITDNGVMRWSDTVDGNHFGTQIRFALMLPDNDRGDWNDFPYQAWGFWDDGIGPGVDGNLGADAWLTVPFATFYQEETNFTWVNPRTCGGFNATCPRAERENSDLIISTLLDSAETIQGQKVTGQPGAPDEALGRRTERSFQHNLVGRFPLSALLRDAQILIHNGSVADPFRTCRQTFVLIITGGASSLEEDGTYGKSEDTVRELADGFTFGGFPLQGFGLRVRTFVVGLNVEDRTDGFGNVRQERAERQLDDIADEGDVDLIEHENADDSLIRVDLELGEEDGASASEKNQNNKQMVAQLRDALREKVFRPILEHETVLRRQPFGMSRSRADEAVGDDPLFFLVDPVFRVGQYYSSYDSGIPGDADVQPKTPWRSEIKRRRYVLRFEPAENREVLLPDDNNPGTPLVPDPTRWDLMTLRKNRPIYSAFPPNWNMVDIHPNALGGADKARLAELIQVADVAEVDKILWRMVCPRPRIAGEAIGVWPNNNDCMPGELYHSEVVMGFPPKGAGEEKWRRYVGDWEANEWTATMAYMTTGDGQVHAFVVDADGLGNQATYERRALWSYVPYSVLYKLRYLPGMTAAFTDVKVEGLDYRTKPAGGGPPLDPIVLEEGKEFYLDSTVVIQDLFFPSLDEYRRVMAGGTRGGRGYFAIDITGSSKLTATPPVRFIGEYTPKLERFYKSFDDFFQGTNNDHFQTLAFCWQPPLLGHINLDPGGMRAGRNPIMAFGGGYAPVMESTPDVELGQSFYMVDLDNRDMIWRQHIGGLCECGTGGCPASKCSLSAPYHFLLGRIAGDGASRSSSIKSMWFGNSEGRLFKLITRDGLYQPVPILPDVKHIISTKPAAWGYWDIQDDQLDYWDQYNGSGFQAAREPIVNAPAIVRDIDGSNLLVVSTGNPEKVSDMNNRQQWVFVLRDTFDSVPDPADASVNILRSKLIGELASPFESGACDASETCGAGCCLSRLLLEPNKRPMGTPAVVFGQVFFTANEPMVTGGCLGWNRWLYGMNILNLHGGLLFDGGGNRTISSWVAGKGAVTKAVVPAAAPNQVIAPTFQDIGLTGISSSSGSTGFATTGIKQPKCRTESWGGLL